MATVNEKMTAIADAIRAKTGGTEPLTLDGMAENIQKVYEAGKQAQYDEFWDTIQNNGERTNYTMAFANPNWTDELFQPKYDLVSSTFYRCWYGATGITRIPKTLDGSTISTSTGFNQTFYSANNLVSIEKIVSRAEAPWENTFRGCYALENVVFEGEIGDNIDFNSCSKLTHDSLISSINALKDYSSSGTVYTVTLGTTNLAKLTDEEKAIATQKGWTLA